MSDPANTLAAFGDPEYLAAMGAAAMAINSLPRLKKFGVVDGGRRMLGERTPGRADLKIVKGENQQCR